MNDSLENKLTMYNAVADLLDDNSAKIAPIPALVDSFNNFKALIDDISVKNVQKNSAAAGKTKTKKQLQMELILDTVPVAGALYALGSKTNNPKLMDIGNAKKGTLMHLRDTELPDRIKIIKEHAEANLAQLADFGINAAQLTALENKNISYTNSIGDKESSFAVKYASGKVLTQIFKDADLILDHQIDLMMEQFAASDQQFYLEYKSAREIKDLGHRFDDKETPNPTPPTN